MAGPVFYPTRGLVSKSVGLIDSYVGGEWYRGSAVIARDPRLLFSCAHVYFENGVWATDYLFYRACHQADYPDENEGLTPRGLHYFTSYSSGVSTYGSDSNEAFAADFTVLYRNSSFGPAVGWWAQGGPALRSVRSKRIVGYPAELDYNGADGGCYQHATKWFDYEAFQIQGGYHEFDDVSTGPGNSGGPIFVQDGAGNENLAGILVSGTRRTAGVVALDLSTDSLASEALGLEKKTRTFSYSTATKIPDGSKSYTRIPLKVSGFGGSVLKLKLDFSVKTKSRGDLDVYLTSPSGRVRWIYKRNASSVDDLLIAAKDLTSTYRGSTAGGTWMLSVRDTRSGDKPVFQFASLTVDGY